MKSNRILLVIIITIMFFAVLFLRNIVIDIPQPYIQTGDIAYLGGYRWIVLDIEDNYALIITEDAVIIRETSTVMDYLNNEFLQNFNEIERSLIRKTDYNYIFWQYNNGGIYPMLWLNMGDSLSS